jgi:DNA-binding transcriptional ArsR family regulator
VRNEELDWKIYHQLPAGGSMTVGDLVQAGYDPLTVEASLARLEEAGLIERRGETVRPLSFQEAILLCQVRNDRESPFCIENGIIRTKTGKERKE